MKIPASADLESVVERMAYELARRDGIPLNLVLFRYFGCVPEEA